MPARNSPKRKPGFALPEQLIRDRVDFASSGAAGVHDDQKARQYRTGATNRIGSRSSRLRAAIRFEDR
ncbi:hypothetical protein [Arthrobacter sp. H14]|uniref:hypothetical protein n=1 Tax=Arthrobacter sp. H14 TaxID=1312959 RepID=UPI000478F726|nr:hypothetical protein [Arthrobacter sp. H14]